MLPIPNCEFAKAELPNTVLPNRELPSVVFPTCESSIFDRTRFDVTGLEPLAQMSFPWPDPFLVEETVPADPIVDERFEPAPKLGAFVFAAIVPPDAGPAPGALASEALPPFPNECH